MTADWIVPEWPAPPRVRACVTTREGGVSRSPYRSLNLGTHVGDDPAAVRENRFQVAGRLNLPTDPFWLEQVHGCRVVEAGAASVGREADASFTRTSGVVCVVLTADCLPLLLCDRQGECVAAVHAGWRGLADGVIEATLERMGVDPARILAWLGPAIGPDHFEVGEEVRRRFLGCQPGAEQAFRPRNGRWLADIYALAALRLQRQGVTAIFGGGWCTYREQERFFSYRRDGVTGRMATLIWLE